jgi:hypothetical protein
MRIYKTYFQIWDFSDCVFAVKTRKMASNEGVRVRRATSGDYAAVIDINVNVYDKLDYLPVNYQQFVVSPALYATYVAESDDKLVRKMLLYS